MINIKHEPTECQAQKSKENANSLKILQNAFLKNPDFKIYIQDKNEDGEIITQNPLGSWAEAPVPGCPLAVSSFLLDRTKDSPTPNHKRQEPSERFPVLAAEMHTGEVKNNTLQNAVNVHLDRRPKIMVLDDEGNASFFPGQVRGDRTYSETLKSRIHQASREMAEIPGTTLFITLTYGVNQHSSDIFEAVEYHEWMVDNFLRHLRELGELSYISVLEMTAKGYPHTHIILKWRDKFFEGEKNERGQIYLKDRMFYHQLSDYQSEQQFKVVLVTDNAVTNYITKYVSKGLDKTNKQNNDSSNTFTPEERKNALCYMLGYMTHARQVRISKDLKKHTITDADFKLDLTPEEADTLERGESSADADYYNLISILNKLTLQCKSHIYAIFKKEDKEAFAGYEGFISGLTPAEIEEFKQAAYPLGCPGCIVTKFLDYVTKSPVRMEIQPRKEYDFIQELVAQALG
jgi:hypothetical protein